MIRKLAALAMLLALSTPTTFGQGTILFNNRVIGQVDAPFCRPDGSGLGAGFVAQLFLVTGGSTYTALSPATTFRTTSAAAAFYVVQPSSAVIVPNVSPGQQATIVMRAWEGALGSSFDTALVKGESNPITITLGGVPAQGAPIQDAVLAGLQGVCILPEPGTIALALLGGAALFCRKPRR